MESSDECCVISNLPSERSKVPRVTSVKESASPLPRCELKKEETPGFDGTSCVQDSSVIRQGRLLFPTGSSNTANESTSNPSPQKSESSAVLVGLKKWLIEGGQQSNKANSTSPTPAPLSPPTATTDTTMTSPPKTVATSNVSPPQVSPKIAKQKLTKEEKEKLRVEKEQQKAEKDKERAEAKAKREEEKEKRKQEKQRKEEEKRERQRKREQEMKERQEKREREEQEKKERREKREAEKQRREDEKKRKEEEKRQMELEKEQAKEEKLRKEQQAQKRIVSFFNVLPPKEIVQNKSVVDSDFFVLTPFPRKPGVTLAALPRPPLEDSTHFDLALSKQDGSHGNNYLDECKNKPKIMCSRERKCVRENIPEDKGDECTDMEVDDDDVIIISPSTSTRHLPRPINVRYKLLQFHTNHRPAYFGTWRKKSRLINPRNPFKKDTDLLDYEVDSDDEWEEEEPGESLSDSEGEDAGGESGDDDDEEDGFFVPHGYLSDSEGDHSGDEGNPGEDQQDLKQQKQVSRAKAWEAEFARKCQPLRPIKIGCLWTRGDQEQEGGGVPAISKEMEFLQQFEAVPLVELPIAIETKGETTAEASESNKPRAVPEEAMPDLIHLIHKNSMGLTRLIKIFRTHWGAKVTNSSPPGDDPLGLRERSTSPSNDVTKTTDNATVAVSADVSPFCSSSKLKTPGTNNGNDLENASGISKRQLEKKIQSIATKEVRAPSNKQLWYVHDAVLEKYGIDGNSVSPLRPLSSCVTTAKSGNENATTPQTPCGSGATRKRKIKGVKSLFDFEFISSSAASSSTATSKSGTTAGSAGEEGNVAIVNQSKALATPLSPQSNNTAQIVSSPTTTTNLEPPLKKPRLESSSTTPGFNKNNSSKSEEAMMVVVGGSDDSSNKENDSGSATTATESGGGEGKTAEQVGHTDNLPKHGPLLALSSQVKQQLHAYC